MQPAGRPFQTEAQADVPPAYFLPVYLLKQLSLFPQFVQTPYIIFWNPEMCSNVGRLQSIS